MHTNKRNHHPAQGDSEIRSAAPSDSAQGHRRLRFRIPRPRRRPSPAWVDLAPHVLDAPPSSSDPIMGRPETRSPEPHNPAPRRLTRRQADDLALMLRSRRIPHRLSRSTTGSPLLLVPERAARTAIREVRMYIEENRHQGELIPDWTRAPRVGLNVLAPLMALLAFFVFVDHPAPSLGFYPELWLDRGAAVADLILAGHFERAVTALTLHADPAHALGNAVVGAVFAVCVCRELGNGTGWAAIIVSGITGNILNALYHADNHTAVGFSTAVFGAAGILAGYRLGHGSILTFRFKLAPIAAGLGLVAMLGAGGVESNIDFGSHLFGFASGTLLGIALGLIYRRHGLPSKTFDRAAYVFAWMLPVTAWLIAWRG